MTTKMKLGVVSLTSSILLIGCGTSIGLSDNVGAAVDALNGISTGYFIDAAVSGVSYSTTSGESGVTDQSGRFKYKNGDTVTFKIGNLILGDATPKDGLITPTLLANGDQQVTSLLLRTLQSLDSDRNASNGITIPSNILLSGFSETRVSDLTESALLQLDTNLTTLIDTNNDNKIDVNQTQAQAHFTTSIQEWNSGKKPDNNSSLSGSNSTNNPNVTLETQTGNTQANTQGFQETHNSTNQGDPQDRGEMNGNTQADTHGGNEANRGNSGVNTQGVKGTHNGNNRGETQFGESQRD